MKLKLLSVDFEENTISFEVPTDIMQKTHWKSGSADVTISDVCYIENELNKPVNRDIGAGFVNPSRVEVKI